MGTQNCNICGGFRKGRNNQTNRMRMARLPDSCHLPAQNTATSNNRKIFPQINILNNPGLPI